MIVFCCLAVFTVSLHARPQRDVSGPLRYGVMASTAALPIVVARDMGFFEAEGLEVEVIVFASPQDRDAAIQAGQLDGASSDLLAAFFFNAAGFDFRITSLNNGRFGILGSPNSGLTSLADLRGRRIGFFPNTMTQHIADSKLEAAGVSMFDYDPVAVPNILLRFEMLMNDQIDAIVVPEPFMTAAEAQGAIVLASTDDTDLDLGAFFFSGNALRNRLDDITAFHRAIYRAILLINENPDAFRDYLVEQMNFPPAIRDQFQFFTFSKPALPTEYQFTRAQNWLRARNVLQREITLGDIIDARPTTGW